MTDKHAHIALDETLCIDCRACEIACKQQNDIPAGTKGNLAILRRVEGTFPQVSLSYELEVCRQCEDPLCARACPTEAIEKRTSDGVVAVHARQCIGCASCISACPWRVPRIRNKTMIKCNLCAGCETERSAPRCVEACPTQALSLCTVPVR